MESNELYGNKDAAKNSLYIRNKKVFGVVEEKYIGNNAVMMDPNMYCCQGCKCYHG
jgi:hypothetical protein